MKRIFFLVIMFWVGGAVASSIEEFIHRELAVDTTEFAHQVYQRYYFIRRLNRCMNIYAWLHDHQPRAFNHFVLNRPADSSYHRLVSLLSAWDDFKAYKMLGEDDFVQQIIQDAVIMAVELSTGYQYQRVGKGHDAVVLTVEQQLDVLDTFVIRWATLAPTADKEYGLFENTIEDVLAIKSSIDLDQISLRYYHVQRLREPMIFIEKLHERHFRLPERLLAGPFTIAHKKVADCLVLLEQQMTVEPLINLWQEIQHYNDVDNDLLVKEFSVVLFLIYKHLVFRIVRNNPHLKNFNTLNLINVTEHIDSISLEELLMVLNFVAGELPDLLEQYELNSELSWSDWWEKYWWTPTLIVSVIAAKYLWKYHLSADFAR